MLHVCGSQTQEQSFLQNILKRSQIYKFIIEKEAP